MVLSISDSDPQRIEQYRYQDQIYQQNALYPYGTDDFMKAISVSESSRQQYKNTLAEIYNFYGMYKTRFPCASTCWNEELYNNNDDDDVCEASVLDAIHPISTSITKHCTYVIYYVNFDIDWNQMLDPPKEFMGVSPIQPSKLCRIAFVSSESVMIQNLIKEHYHNKEKDSFGNRLFTVLNSSGFRIFLLPDQFSPAIFLCPELRADDIGSGRRCCRSRQGAWDARARRLSRRAFWRFL